MTSHFLFFIPVNNTPGLIREVYKEIRSSGQMRSLYHDKKYPFKPDEISLITNFDVPQNIDDNYGQRVRGYFVAPENGEYKFYSSCDDMCELYLSMDSQSNHVSKILSQGKASKHDEFNK